VRLSQLDKYRDQDRSDGVVYLWGCVWQVHCGQCVDGPDLRKWCDHWNRSEQQGSSRLSSLVHRISHCIECPLSLYQFLQWSSSHFHRISHWIDWPLSQYQFLQWTSSLFHRISHKIDSTLSPLQLLHWHCPEFVQQLDQTVQLTAARKLLQWTSSLFHRISHFIELPTSLFQFLHWHCPKFVQQLDQPDQLAAAWKLLAPGVSV
jgi:hypothetical protein